MLYYKKRVVITGLGCISPLGNSINKTWKSIISGKSGINKITNFDTSSYNTKIAGEIKNFNIKKYLNFKNIKKLDKFIYYGIAAGIQAFQDSNLEINKINNYRIGIIMGSGFGGLYTIEKNFKNIIYNNNKDYSSLISSLNINTISGQLSIIYNIKGPNYSLSNSCVTGTDCIGMAKKIIENGNADIMIVGSSESVISPLVFKGFDSMKILSKKNNNPKIASRPWDKNRDGIVLGEGSGVLILEEYNYAKKRNANIYAELIGFSINNNSYHLTKPNIIGAAKCINNALYNAKINKNDIQYLNAHGVSTKLGDKYETDIIKLVFKKYAYKLLISSTKSMTGHLLGGSGSLESIFTILSIYYQVSPPTINILDKDCECDLNYCANKAQNIKINIAMKNSFGFGGINSTLIFKKI